MYKGKHIVGALCLTNTFSSFIGILDVNKNSIDPYLALCTVMSDRIVLTLIRRRVLWRLISVYTVCQCPFHGTRHKWVNKGKRKAGKDCNRAERYC